MITDKTLERWRKHGQMVKEFFGLPDEVDAIILYRKLLKIEASFSAKSLKHCNGYISDEAFDNAKKSVVKALAALGIDMKKIHINTDPRGYALKIKDNLSRDFGYRDMGGHGILAPDLTGR